MDISGSAIQIRYMQGSKSVKSLSAERNLASQWLNPTISNSFFELHMYSGKINTIQEEELPRQKKALSSSSSPSRQAQANRVSSELEKKRQTISRLNGSYAALLFMTQDYSARTQAVRTLLEKERNDCNKLKETLEKLVEQQQ